MLVCNNVECRYGNKIVFEGLSFSASEGSLIVLHGHNGTGKTSLLHMIAGLKTPRSGTIHWGESPIKEAIRNHEIDMIFMGHEPMVKPELTVMENISFWADLSGDRNSIPYALKKFDLESYVDTKCDQLSKGWQKRVALARLIFSPSDLWVLDEPYNNLDHEVSKLLDGIVADKIKVGGVVILSSHTYVPIESAIKVNISEFAPRKGRKTASYNPAA